MSPAFEPNLPVRRRDYISKALIAKSRDTTSGPGFMCCGLECARSDPAACLSFW